MTERSANNEFKGARKDTAEPIFDTILALALRDSTNKDVVISLLLHLQCMQQVKLRTLIHLINIGHIIILI
jgi:hypothetical protein